MRKWRRCLGQFTLRCPALQIPRFRSQAQFRREEMEAESSSPAPFWGGRGEGLVLGQRLHRWVMVPCGDCDGCRQYPLGGLFQREGLLGESNFSLRAEATSLPTSVALYSCRPGPAGHSPSRGREKVLDPHGSAKEEEREVREVWGWCGGLAGLLRSSATP